MEKGFVLVIVLILLFVATLLATTALQGSALELRMGKTMQRQQMIFNAAEIGLHQGWQWLQSRDSHEISPIKHKMTIDTIKIEYIIEKLTTIPCVKFYRVTAFASAVDYPTAIAVEGVFAKIEKQDHICNGVNPINHGLLAWRKLKN